MTQPLEETVSLPTIANGAATERFEDEMETVLDNILDPNTEAEVKRSITIKITLKPNADRDQAAVLIESSSKLAPFKAVGSGLFMGRRHGKACAVEHNPKQMQMAWDEESRPTPIKKEEA